MARRTRQTQRATERLNIALARIQAPVGMLEAGGPNALPQLKKQIDDAIEEAYAALADIRQAAASI